ncbi:MAG TPA: hypothetical protein VF575_00600 [Candidatus Saccharimonadales bacterium]|jgi:hypothetical protein
MNPTHEFETYQTVHSYAKIYPTFTKLFVFNHPSQVRIKGYEIRAKKKEKGITTNFTDPVTLIDSLRRTKTRLTDIAVSNDFDLFCTFTFAKDRQNVDHLKKQMSRWLNHQQERAGKFSYLIVPEFHKDGKSIHFHALFKDYPGQLTDTGHKTKRGQTSYEIKSYKLGYSTAVKIDDIEKVGSYIKKYITKDMPQFNGKKRYWCSHGLQRPKKVMNPVVFPSDMKHFTTEHQIPNMKVHVASKKIDFVGEVENIQTKNMYSNEQPDIPLLNFLRRPNQQPTKPTKPYQDQRRLDI